MARPKFKPTPAQRRRVAITAGAGMAHEVIAISLGISRNTLEKHFEFELSVGAYQKRAEVIEAMHAAAKNGNVAAQKAYAAMNEPRIAAPPVPKDRPMMEQKPEGKKAQQQADAVTAAVGTDWDNLLGPRAVQ